MKKLVIASMCILFVLPCVAFSQVILPPLEQPESVVVVPSGGSDVYLVPGVEGLYFFRGSWFRLNDGYWFRSPAVYGSPWAPMSLAAVPNAIIAIPPTYISSLPPDYPIIPFNDFRRNWRPWGQSHHWGNQGWYRDHRTHYWGGHAFYNPNDTRRGWQGSYGHDGRHVQLDRGRVDHGRTGPGRVDRGNVNRGNVNRGNVNRSNVNRGNVNRGRTGQDDRNRGR